MRRLFLITTLLLALTAARGAVIHHPSEPAKGAWYCFIGDIDLNDAGAVDSVLIAADTKYWLWINGEAAVFEGGLKQGPDRSGMYADTFRSFAQLRDGRNRICLLLWHFGKDGFSHRSGPVAGIDLRIFSGGKMLAQSDGSWKCIRHPAYYIPRGQIPNFRLAESNVGYDARRALAWTEEGFDCHKWKDAVIAPSDVWGDYVERPIPQWKDFGLKKYDGVRRVRDTLFCRLPYNCQFTPFLKVNAPEGRTVSIRTDHYISGGPASVRAEYITRSGVQEYESLGWMNGHEAIYVIPQNVEVLELKYRETGYDTSFAGSFRCNDPFLGRLWEKSRRTLYITMRDNFMDCPDRERAQWWGDAVNELGEAFYCLDSRAQLLTRKAILELAAWQREDSTLFSPVPAGNWEKELPLQMLASVSRYGFWTYYMGTGDISTLRTVFPAVMRYLKIWKVGDNSLVQPRSGGWDWVDWGLEADREAMTSLWYIIALDGAARMARTLGREEDALWADATASDIREAFDRECWRGNCYISASHEGLPDDRTQALAVLAGVVPRDRYPLITDFLMNNFHASPYMEKYVLEALCEMGRCEDAVKRMHIRYGEMVESPESTLWEGWGTGDTRFGRGTLNHAWSGGPLTIMSRYLAGVRETAPGFAEFLVKPEMAGLKNIDAQVPTSFGNIKVSLRERRGSVIRLTLYVPEGTSAYVLPPEGWSIRGLSSGAEVRPGRHRIRFVVTEPCI